MTELGSDWRGFPGIPLAIMFPDVHFHLVDSIDKKVKVVEAIYKALGLRNITVEQTRAEDIKEKYDFVVTRAVADLMILYEWSINLIRRGLSFNDVPNGLIALKGGNLEMEDRSVGVGSLGCFEKLLDVRTPLHLRADFNKFVEGVGDVLR